MSRIKIINLLVTALFTLLIFKLAHLDLVQGKTFRQLSDKNCIRLLPQEGARGKILDKNSRVVVDSRLSYDVMALPRRMSDMEPSFLRLSEILGISVKNLEASFRNNYVSLSLPVTIARNIDMRKAMVVEELKQELSGIIIQPNPVRNYPHGKLASHLLGYVSEIDRWRLTKLEDYGYKTKDVVGFGGIEERYDYYLRQEEGGLSMEVDSLGRVIRPLGFKQPQNGKELQLTIDLKLQQIVESKLEGREGCVIIMEPDTGAISSLASYPDFDPSVFVSKSNVAISGIMVDPESPLINRAITGLYPAGSVFKPIVAAAALENRKINAYSIFHCQGLLMIGKQKFACSREHGNQNLVEAIAHSCNVFFYKAGLSVGSQVIHDYAIKFGLSRPTLFELPYEESGFVPSPLWSKFNKFKNWFDGDTANLSIGQGEVLVTPLQVTRMMSVFANKGYLVTPYVVKAVNGQEISQPQRKKAVVVLKKPTMDLIRQGLRDVVLQPTGTAHILSTLPVSVAGKTGTAQAPPGQAHGWFVGFFPFNNPKFVICVFLEHGGSGYASCVVAKQIIEEMVNQNLI